MIASINRIVKEACILCGRDGEALDADFGKLKGAFCRPCFLRVLKARNSANEKRSQAPAEATAIK